MIKLPHFIRYPKQHRPLNWLMRPRPPKIRHHVVPVFSGGTVVNPGPDAIEQACRRLGLERVWRDAPIQRRHSIGAAAVDPNSRHYWLKISGYKGAFPDKLRQKLLGPPAIAGVPMPLVLKTAGWASDGIHWLATQMTPAPSPAIERNVFATDIAGRVSDQWIASLKTALDCLNASTIHAQYHMSPEQVRNSIVRRWGADAPHAVDDWRLAHGDLQWSTVTAPNLMFIDWNEWGLAPRGHDAAKLIIFAIKQPDLMRRLEAAFAEDRSGRVALLVHATQMLRHIEGKPARAEHCRLIQEKAQQIFSGR